MPMDGLGSDAGRQSLTEVGAGGAHAARTHARPGRAAPETSRTPAPDEKSLLTPATENEPLPTVGLRGERLVAVCALAVLAFAAVFFVERIGGLRGAPIAPPVAPGPEAPVTTRDVEPATEGATAPAPTSEAPPPLRATRTAHAARSTPAPLATMRKPQGRSPHRAPPSYAASPLRASVPIVLASAGAMLADDGERSRWARMRDEVAGCADREHFLDAVLCDQRVRRHYCDDWWGLAAECPSGRQADYGN